MHNPKDPAAADPQLRVPMRWEPTAEEARLLPHAVLLGAAICGISRTTVRFPVQIPGEPGFGARIVQQAQPLNDAAREIFRRLAEWDKLKACGS